MPEAQAPAPAHRQTAYLAASTSGVNNLQARGKPVSLAVLSGELYMCSWRRCLASNCFLQAFFMLAHEKMPYWLYISLSVTNKLHKYMASTQKLFLIMRTWAALCKVKTWSVGICAGLTNCKHWYWDHSHRREGEWSSHALSRQPDLVAMNTFHITNPHSQLLSLIHEHTRERQESY